MSSELLSLQHPALAQLDQWIADGWIRPLDRALATLLLDEGDEQDSRVLLLAALASQQLGQGDICVDLQRATTTPVQLFPHPPRTDSSDSPLSWLQQQTLEQLLAALHDSNVVSSNAENDSAPLVLHEQLLYLRRYYRYESDVAAQISERLGHPVATPSQLGERLDNLFPARSDNQPDWQKIACALASRSAFTLITGGPGTGKTYTVARLLALLFAVDEAPQRLRVGLAALDKDYQLQKTQREQAVQIRQRALVMLQQLSQEKNLLYQKVGSYRAVSSHLEQLERQLRSSMPQHVMDMLGQQAAYLSR